MPLNFCLTVLLVDCGIPPSPDLEAVQHVQVVCRHLRRGPQQGPSASVGQGLQAGRVGEASTLLRISRNG